MCFRAAAIRGRRAILRGLDKGFSVPLSVVAVVVLLALAGCGASGAGDSGVESEGPSMAGEGGEAHPDAAIRGPEETAPEVKAPAKTVPEDTVFEVEAPENEAIETAPEIPGSRPKTVIPGSRQGPVSTAPSDGVDWGADRLDSDARNRLIEQEKRLRGRIDTLDRQLKAFDANPPSRAARESDPRGRPEVLERRLDVERRTLEAQVRQIRRELQWLRMESSPTFTGPGSVGTSPPSLFGGSDPP